LLHLKKIKLDTTS